MKLRGAGKHLIIITLLSIVFVGLIYALFPHILKFFGKIVNIFLPFILGYLVSLLINPLADKLRKKLKLPRGLSALLVIILTLGIIGGVITGIIFKLIEEIRSLYEHYPQIYSDMVEMYKEFSVKYSDFYEAMPDAVQNVIDGMGQQLSAMITGFFERVPVVEKAGNIAMRLPAVFVAFIIFILSLYFMIVDSERVRDFLRKLFPERISEKISNTKEEMKKYIGGYLKAQGIIMCIAFVIIFTGLSILNVEYALLIAIAVAIFDALPLFGSGAILWPWLIVSFLGGSVKMGVGLLIVYLSIIFTRQMIEPKIVSTNIGLHPILTLMAMYVGFKLFSIGGMILGPVTLMFLISFYKAGLLEPIIRFIKTLYNFIKREFAEVKNIFRERNE